MPDFRFLDEVESQEQNTDSEESMDSYLEDLSDVEARLEEANCYKALLQSPLFGEDSPDVAERVELKVKEFIRKELGILLGLEAPITKVVEQYKVFEDDEVVLLKTWAGVLKGRPHLLNGKPSEPEVNRVTVVKPPEVATANVAKPTATVKPVTTKQTRKPRVKKEDKSKKVETKAESAPKTIKRKVEVNGVVTEVEMNVARQVKPGPDTPEYQPPMDPETAAMYNERIALTRKPSTLISMASQIATNSED